MWGSVRFISQGELTLTNYTSYNCRQNGANIKMSSGHATFTNVVINSDEGGCVDIGDGTPNTERSGAVAELTNCTFNQSGYYNAASAAVITSRSGHVILNSGTYSGYYGLFPHSSGGTITVKDGCTITGSYNAVHTVKLDYPAQEDHIINIEGGTINGSFDVYNNDGHTTFTITGGTFDHDPTQFVTEGYEAINNGDGTWTVQKAAVAQIGETTYATLAAAVAAVPTTGTATTITMLADHAAPSAIVIPAGVNAVLDLAGKNLSYSGEGDLLTVSAGATFEVKTTDGASSVTGGIQLAGKANDLANGGVTTISKDVTVDLVTISATTTLNVNECTITKLVNNDQTTEGPSTYSNISKYSKVVTTVAGTSNTPIETNITSLESNGNINLPQGSKYNSLMISTLDVKGGDLFVKGKDKYTKTQIGTVNMTSSGSLLLGNYYTVTSATSNTDGFVKINTINMNSGSLTNDAEVEVLNLTGNVESIYETNASSTIYRLKAVNSNNHKVNHLRLSRIDNLDSFSEIGTLTLSNGNALYDKGVTTSAVDLSNVTVSSVLNGMSQSSGTCYFYITGGSATEYGDYVVVPNNSSTAGPAVVNDQYSFPTITAAYKYATDVLKTANPISIKLTGDIANEPYWVINNKTVTLDLNAHKVNFLGNVNQSSASSKMAVYILSGGVLTINNTALSVNNNPMSSEITATTADSNWLFDVKSGTLNFNAYCTIKCYGVAAYGETATAIFNINNGTWRTNDDPNYLLNLKDNCGGQINVNGGRFYGFNPDPTQNTEITLGENKHILSYNNGEIDIYDVVSEITVMSDNLGNIGNNSGWYNLNSDVSGTNIASGMFSSASTVLNLGEYTYSNTRTGYPAILGRGSFTMDIYGTTGKVENVSQDRPIVWASGPLVVLSIHGGFYDSGANSECIYCEKGIINIDGGVFKTTNNDKSFLLNCLDSNAAAGTARIVVTGGTFWDFNPANNTADGANTSYVPAGYTVNVDTTSEPGHTLYTVVQQ